MSESTPPPASPTSRSLFNNWISAIGGVLAIGALGFQVGLTGKRHPLLGALLIGMLTGGMMLVVDLSRARLGFMRVDTAPLDWTLQGFPPAAKK